MSVQSPAEGVAHRAEPTPHRGRPAAVGQRRVRLRGDGRFRVERVGGTHRPDRVLVRLRRDVRRDVVHRSRVRLHLERRESHERVVTRVRDVRVRVEGARHRELHVTLARAQPNLPERDVASHERREPGGGDDELEAGGRRHGGKPRGPRAGGVGDGGGHRARGSAEVPVEALASVRLTRRSPQRFPRLLLRGRRGLRRLGSVGSVLVLVFLRLVSLRRVLLRVVASEIDAVSLVTGVDDLHRDRRAGRGPAPHRRGLRRALKNGVVPDDERHGERARGRRARRRAAAAAAAALAALAGDDIAVTFGGTRRGLGGGVAQLRGDRSREGGRGRGRRMREHLQRRQHPEPAHRGDAQRPSAPARGARSLGGARDVPVE